MRIFDKTGKELHAGETIYFYISKDYAVDLHAIICAPDHSHQHQAVVCRDAVEEPLGRVDIIMEMLLATYGEDDGGY